MERIKRIKLYRKQKNGQSYHSRIGTKNGHKQEYDFF